ncbi:winged helix-turn-helix transcriptional regulator [Streptomyces sp. GKU 257-1]|nr:winged helix-turn-helix transcriptional regulator [Streptomyces sp. GKU 257-1]
MGWWQVSADTLAGSRFVVSPLAETIAGLKVLERGSAAHPGERAWLAAHRPAYRARQAADPVTEQLIRAALGPTWNADFLTPPPDPGAHGAAAASFAAELACIRATPPQVARADLLVSLGSGPLPGILDRDDLPHRTAETLEWVWHETVLPYWPRRRRIIEADVVARTAQLGRGGWAAALDDMRPGMRWLGGSRLQINARNYPPRELDGARLMMFVPVTPHTGWVSWEALPVGVPQGQARPPTGVRPRYAVVYPCSGTLADTGHPAVPQALGALLGPARAAVLVLLDSPKSTTQLVALTGQGLGSVGRHLRVLRDARLIQGRRAGRSVLYHRTAAGEGLLRAQE